MDLYMSYVKWVVYEYVKYIYWYVPLAIKSAVVHQWKFGKIIGLKELRFEI